MTAWQTYFFISLVTVISGTLSIFAGSTINLLLYVVIIIFSQGVSLLMLSTNIVSLYLIIVYLGAIVILFSFMILFVNWKGETRSLKIYYKLLIATAFSSGFIFFLHLIGVSHLKNSSLGGVSSLSEHDIMKNISEVFYSELLAPLFLMVNILMLGLILVIRIILRPEN